MQKNRHLYPFSALVGQERLKKGLLLNVLNPSIGGVLIRGEKGTAKSTAVRGLAGLLPEIEVSSGCPFGCDPAEFLHCPHCRERVAEGKSLQTELRRTRVTELPVGATEDRVLGTLDLERAIKSGEKHFEPGILAQAHRGILYVDEVNLLEDHIVDVLLDAAAMGVNTVEREGVSYSHPARFVLVGTMNPEEGELRPQLLDRFGLCCEVAGISDPDERMEVVRRRVAFDEDPAAFNEKWQPEEEKLTAEISRARELLGEVGLADSMLKKIVTLSIEFKVDGHRGDIVMVKTAKALAALHGLSEVGLEEVQEAAEIVLPHRMRRNPFDAIGLDLERVKNGIRN